MTKRRRTVRPELARQHAEAMAVLHGTGEKLGKPKTAFRRVPHWSANGLIEIEVDGKHAKRERGGRPKAQGTLPRHPAKERTA